MTKKIFFGKYLFKTCLLSKSQVLFVQLSRINYVELKLNAQATPKLWKIVTINFSLGSDEKKSTLQQITVHIGRSKEEINIIWHNL